MKYNTDDGIEVINFNASHGYQVGDSIDELVIEEVYDLPNEGASILFMKMDNNDLIAQYQYVTAFGQNLAMSNASFDSLEEAIGVYDDEDGWRISDQDCRQKFKKIDENRFLYREDRISNPETGETYVYQSDMDFSDYDQDSLEKGVEAYYKNVDEVKSIYGNDWKQIVLECIFEQEDSDIEMGYGNV
jgi:hypothetical protein